MAVGSEAGRIPAASRRKGVVTRRAVLATALAGGAGVATLRLLDLRPAGVAPARRAGDWASPLADESAQVKQLLRRATFGAGPADLEQALTDGYRKTLTRLLETPAAQPPPLPGADDASRTSPLDVRKLQGWWIDHMLGTQTPFAERMTLFWHGHFTSDFRKVGVQYPYLYWQNQTWRDNALGDFRNFLYAVTVDPAMLRYLDLGTSTGQAPNENYARELMELFTMGAGSFSEDDVRAAAKGLAGWREPNTAAMVAAQKTNPNAGAAAGRVAADTVRTGVFVPRRAYSGGPVTFLGRTAQFDTKGILAQIIAQPATAPHVVQRVLVHFALPNPPAAMVKRLAANFVRSGWSIRQLMSDVFTSDEFKSQAAYRSLVKQPAEFMVHALRAVEAKQQVPLAIAAASGMGQVLFDPPDVGGWPLNESWVSSNTMVARVNFVTRLLAAARTLPSASRAHLEQLDGVLGAATRSLLESATSDLERWTILLASPEFQLK